MQIEKQFAVKGDMAEARVLSKLTLIPNSCSAHDHLLGNPRKGPGIQAETDENG
jgi:hypothetical protein